MNKIINILKKQKSIPLDQFIDIAFFSTVQYSRNKTI